ncbi:hypothetical protein HYFRA_00014000 [Hymenoscyphus fraxineus]|uniref:Uncharacterized protein n=1 Tax=Hymenoscyphus fraxineus TaxID=746836 RepID=A0A9N9LA11_9HELO|nr:hypothetical protein HYFRA_00014000 [Hymenoscyphus fraxineus]
MSSSRLGGACWTNAKFIVCEIKPSPRLPYGRGDLEIQNSILGSRPVQFHGYSAHFELLNFNVTLRCLGYDRAFQGNA